MGLSRKFSRPLLIYDDKCYSCTEFAKAASILSRGRIRTVGHYYSKEAIEAKKIIFPVDYDPTNMFWLINKKGAYGARSGLVQVAKEIIIGLFKGRDSKSYGNDNDNNNSNPNNLDLACEYKDRMTLCGSTDNTFRRIVNMMMNSGRFRFRN
jgi:hypothetical protein